MAIDCGTEIEGGQERSGISTIDVSNEDASSAAEARDLLIDQIQYENEFQAAGQEDGREKMMNIVIQGLMKICHLWCDD